jgi:hypothetical protein
MSYNCNIEYRAHDAVLWARQSNLLFPSGLLLQKSSPVSVFIVPCGLMKGKERSKAFPTIKAVAGSFGTVLAYNGKSLNRIF